jgi:PTH1 family peptidyl-tRNA hydrolase
MFFWKRDLSVSWVFVFLGNPGPRYADTRHNVGFWVADIVAEKTGVRIDRLKYSSLTAVATLGAQRVFLMKPQTYMNLSGGAVRQAMRFYKVPLSNVVVVSDDVALPVGKLRIRRMGSAGGHNGLKDIISKCGGEGFPRIKIGVGSPPDGEYEMSDWVLSKIRGGDEKLIRDAAARAADALDIMVNSSIEQAMGEFN